MGLSLAAGPHTPPASLFCWVCPRPGDTDRTRMQPLRGLTDHQRRQRGQEMTAGESRGRGESWTEPVFLWCERVSILSPHRGRTSQTGRALEHMVEFPHPGPALVLRDLGDSSGPQSPNLQNAQHLMRYCASSTSRYLSQKNLHLCKNKLTLFITTKACKQPECLSRDD